METVSKIFCILDACTIINLIHIDDNDYLIKKLKYLNIQIAETVFKEVNNNVFDKYNNLRKDKRLGDINITDIKKEIDRKLTIFRGFQTLDYIILKDFGPDYFESVKDLSGYNKKNGEFYSACLALYITRCEPTKLFFHTDDYPAKEELTHFYNFQQIGYIEDSADLLILLYRLDEDFNATGLDNSLSALFSEYALEVVELEKKLKKLLDIISITLRRDRNYMKNLNILIMKLNKHDFKGIGNLKDFFYSNKTRYKTTVEILELHSLVFSLESETNNLLKKITYLRKGLKRIYCPLSTPKIVDN